MAKTRSWSRLLFTSLLVGIGVAIARARRPSRVQPTGSVPAVPAFVPSSIPDNPDAATKPIELAKVAELASEDQLRAEAPQEPSSGEPASTAEESEVKDEAPPLAFVPEMPVAPVPPRAGFSSAAGLVPGFAGDQSTGTYWIPPSTVAAVPELLPSQPGPLGRLSTSVQSWRNRTPTREVIYTLVGAVCLVAAVVVTIVVLTV